MLNTFSKCQTFKQIAMVSPLGIALLLGTANLRVGKHLIVKAEVGNLQPAWTFNIARIKLCIIQDQEYNIASRQSSKVQQVL